MLIFDLAEPKIIKVTFSFHEFVPTFAKSTQFLNSFSTINSHDMADFRVL